MTQSKPPNENWRPCASSSRSGVERWNDPMLLLRRADQLLEEREEA